MAVPRVALLRCMGATTMLTIRTMRPTTPVREHLLSLSACLSSVSLQPVSRCVASVVSLVFHLPVSGVWCLSCMTSLPLPPPLHSFLLFLFRIAFLFIYLLICFFCFSEVAAAYGGSGGYGGGYGQSPTDGGAGADRGGARMPSNRSTPY